MSTRYSSLLAALLLYSQGNVASQTIPTCSTVDDSLTDNCSIAEVDGTHTTTDGTETVVSKKILSFSMEARRSTIQVPNGNDNSTVTIDDALVYNRSLLPEILILRRGDELQIDYHNQLDSAGMARFQPFTDGMNPTASNLHTHGLVVPWDFDMHEGYRGDNVLNLLFNSGEHSGNKGGQYRYPITADHPIGLNWYHPHPHGRTGLQVEGGMSGVMVIADEAAEKLANPIYLVLKDMQTSAVVNEDNHWQFEKFEPEVAETCFTQADTENFEYLSKDPLGSCTYRSKSSNADGSEPATERWFFTINGELYPTLDASKQQLYRLSNNSANMIYRIAMLPDGVDTLSDGEVLYFPPARIIEKDGMTTGPLAKGDSRCLLAVTPATRVGFTIDLIEQFEMSDTSDACKVTAIVDENEQRSYQVKRVTSDDALEDINQQINTITTMKVTNIGIDTEEDDWPAIILANVSISEDKNEWNLEAYREALNMIGPANLVADSNYHVRPSDYEPTPDTACSTTDRSIGLWFLPGHSNYDEKFGVAVADETQLMLWRDQVAVLNDENATDAQTQTAFELLDPLIGRHQFNINRVDVCAQQNEMLAETWTVYNLSSQIHNFHMHQVKFGVTEVMAAECTGSEPYLNLTQVAALGDEIADPCLRSTAQLFLNIPGTFKDTVDPRLSIAARESTTVAMSVPEGNNLPIFGMHDTFPVPPMGYIKFQVKFDTNEKTGEFVFHCHILEHEDAGMMAKIVVKQH